MFKKHHILKQIKQRFRILGKVILNTGAHLKIFFTKTYNLITVLGAVIGFILLYEPLTDLFLSEKQKFEKENIIKGELKSEKIIDSAKAKVLINPEDRSNIIFTDNQDNYYNFESNIDYNFPVRNAILDIKSDSTFLYKDSSLLGETNSANNIAPLIKGIRIKNIHAISDFYVDIKILNREEVKGAYAEPCPPRCPAMFEPIVSKARLSKGYNPFNEDPIASYYQSSNYEFPFVLKLIEDRLFIRAKFRDISNGTILGEIDFNKWKLYRNNILDFDNNDDFLEVIDKHGYITCSIKFKPPNNIVIHGYFYEMPYVWVLKKNEQVFDSVSNGIYQTHILKHIKEIESVK
jgi:hypothetical protein